MSARCTSRQRRARTPGNASLKRSPAATSLRCSVIRPTAELATRCALRSNSRGELETKRAARADPAAALLAATEIAPAGHRLPRSRVRELHRCAPTVALQRRARTPGNAPLKRRAAQGMRPRAQRASLTDSPRLSERSAQRVASSAARPCDEHRSAVCATRRPPQCEPPPATACREAARETQRQQLCN